jgi:AhpD family alkylhydroperoxidase
MQRIQLEKLAPEAHRKIVDLFLYSQANIETPLLNLIMLRASVVNGCAYCVDMHTRDALKAGESAQRLFAVSVWTESPFFSKEERAAFALTDAVTLIGQDGVPDEVWDDARAIWSEKEVADLVMAIIMINAFNRIAASTRKTPVLAD